MAVFPPPPVTTVEWTNMKNLRFQEVNGHIESTYSKATGEWTALKFVSDPYLRVHGMSPALNYGQQVLEGFKAFRMPGSPGNIALFRPDRNATRFQHSAEMLAMPPVPVEKFIQACRAAVALNAGYVPPHESDGSLYIRPLLFGSTARFEPSPSVDYTFCVFVVPTVALIGTSPVKALILDEFDRAAPKGTGHAKVGGNYAPVLRWTEKAKMDGFGITLHLDSARHEEVDEFSYCGFIGVRSHGDGDNDITMAVPDSRCVIDSVTSDSMQQIARSNGWKLEKRPVRYSELPEFSEVFGAGTGVVLVPIRSITRRGTPGLPVKHTNVTFHSDTNTETVTYLADEVSGGPIYRRLLSQLGAIQLGKVPDDFGWRFEIRPEDTEINGGNVPV